MAVDFPSSPTNGQTFVSGSNVYVWSSAKNQWQSGNVQTALPRNYVVNPGMAVSQENGSTGSAAAAAINYWPADQWWGVSNVTTGTVSAGRAVSGAGFTEQPGAFYLFLATTPGVTFGASSHASLNHKIEGNRVADLNWGTAAAKPIVVRFWANSTAAATLTFCIQNGAADRSYLAPFTLAAGTWTLVTLVIPGDTTGTWAKDNTVGMILQWQAGISSTYQGIAGWNAGNKNNLPGATNPLAGASTGVNIANVGMYADPYNTGIAPPWQLTSFAQSMTESQRYWQKLQQLSGMALNTQPAAQRCSAILQTMMRANPTQAFVGTQRAWDIATAPNLSSVQANVTNTYVAEFNYNTSTVMTLGRGAMVIDGNVNVYQALNARI